VSDPLNNTAAKVIKERIRQILTSNRSPAEKEQLIVELSHADPASQSVIVSELATLCRR
jgi:hypothetical protein